MTPTITVDVKPLQAALYELLQALGREGVADALYAAPGVLTIPRKLADTRGGREEITSMVGKAFEDDTIGVILIKDGMSVPDTLRALGYIKSMPTQGYA